MMLVMTNQVGITDIMTHGFSVTCVGLLQHTRGSSGYLFNDEMVCIVDKGNLCSGTSCVVSPPFSIEIHSGLAAQKACKEVAE